ncbi:hypothetical protein VDF13_12165 [Xanthomonas campestris pv. raphani]|uniref:hypothetical protein n=1 Tax=Xanthomonas campestris TaxID=339 RepID=UPI001784059B|nr:hypothetical protein [Xanthomonas campestris]MCC8487602.1 hypothetical protein [Xanthomonas campestris]MDM7867475.1 hypothetical protein [Xanthomonas campestris pv. campestris]MEA9650897.1 hypothetical protein [Xanthomonas campestris pv. raphani]MEA9744183.1 hypothetical protein [Xanthomonas campestris pv. raphani]MEA9767844.1 hypothetical protein [Xanthomonas campestris pv. raphani]
MSDNAKKIRNRELLKVHPAAQFGWDVLSAAAKSSLVKKVAVKDASKTGRPHTYSVTSGDVGVIFQEENGVNTIVSVLTAREMSVFR